MKSELLSNQEEFKDAVNRDLRDQAGTDDEAWLSDNLDDWHAVLVKIKISIETQLGRFKSEKFIKEGEVTNDEFYLWLEGKEAWRSDTLRLKGSVEARLVDVSLLRKAYIRNEFSLQQHSTVLPC